MTLSVFSFRLRDLAGGEDLEGTGVVPHTPHKYACPRPHDLGSASACGMEWFHAIP